ncbi:hypothetical protein BZM27_54605, partial [Paraburkholderia steynii]
RKHPPTFTATQVATLLRIDKTRMKYLTTKNNLPAGTQTGAGRAKVFSREEAPHLDRRDHATDAATHWRSRPSRGICQL